MLILRVINPSKNTNLEPHDLHKQIKYVWRSRDMRGPGRKDFHMQKKLEYKFAPVSYTHLRAHET